MAAPSSSTSGSVRFGAFEADLQTAELRKHGFKIKLEGQPFQILAILLARPGQLVSREELKSALWPADTFVDFEHSINEAIKRLRQALDDSAEFPRFIETLPRRGYRFIHPINGAAAAALDPMVWWHRPWVIGSLALAAAAILLAVGLAKNVAGVRDRVFSPSPRPIHSIAVLPLENLTGDREQEYVADGMTDELTTRLAQIGSLSVRGRTSVMRYKGTKKSVPEIAKELGVDALVEGSIQQSSNTVESVQHSVRG